MAIPRLRIPRRPVIVLAILSLTMATFTPPAASPVAASNPPTVAGCPTLPADNVWNTRIDNLPVHASSADYLTSIGLGTGLKADFGSGLWNGGPIGIPYTTVPGNQPRVNVTFDYDEDSDHGTYPIPPNPPIEGGPNSSGDRHVLVVDRDSCVLYELFDAHPNTDGSWHAGSGAIFPLHSNQLRQAGYTSADAAGLPILPGLARYDEVAAGEIAHALRFTASITQRAYIWPARHYASSNTSPTRPPMSIRVRLRADFDTSGYSPANRVILQALKTYGMILADNGSNWYVSGEPDSRWNNNDLRALANVKGSDFQVVDESSLQINPNSGQAVQPGGGPATSTPTRTLTAAPSQTFTATAVAGTSTPTRTSTLTRTMTAVPSHTSTATTIAATSTPTRTRTPTSTPTFVAKWTPVPPTATGLPATSTRTHTPTVTATSTSAAAPSHTATSVVATLTSTAVPPPTLTRTATNTPGGKFIPTPGSPTPTNLPPTATPTATSTPQTGATPTATPFAKKLG